MRSPAGARPGFARVRPALAAVPVLAALTALACAACGGSQSQSRSQPQLQTQTQRNAGGPTATSATAGPPASTPGASTVAAPSGSARVDGPNGTHATLTVRTDSAQACWTYTLSQDSGGGQSSSSTSGCESAKGAPMRLFPAPSQVASGSGPSYVVLGGTVPAGTTRVEPRYPGGTPTAGVADGLFVAVVPADQAARSASAVALDDRGRELGRVTVPPS
jgi:hypothetical protein